MKEILSRLVRYNISCVKAFELDAGDILGVEGDAHPGAYGHENFRYAAGPLLALYLTDHPENPCHRDPQTLERYLQLADRWFSSGSNRSKAATRSATASGRRC